MSPFFLLLYLLLQTQQFYVKTTGIRWDFRECRNYDIDIHGDQVWHSEKYFLQYSVGRIMFNEYRCISECRLDIGCGISNVRYKINRTRWH